MTEQLKFECINCLEEINGDYYISECLRRVHPQCYDEIKTFNDGNCNCYYDKHTFEYSGAVGAEIMLICCVHVGEKAYWITDDIRLYCDSCRPTGSYSFSDFFDKYAPTIYEKIKSEKMIAYNHTKLFLDRCLAKCYNKELLDEYKAADKQMDIYKQRIDLIEIPPASWGVFAKIQHLKMIKQIIWPIIDVKHFYIMELVYGIDSYYCFIRSDLFKRLNENEQFRVIYDTICDASTDDWNIISRNIDHIPEYISREIIMISKMLVIKRDIPPSKFNLSENRFTERYNRFISSQTFNGSVDASIRWRQSSSHISPF